MGFQPYDRLPVLEWAGWWNDTLARWHGEGLPRELTDRYAICRHFGLDVYKQAWFKPLGRDAPQPVCHGAGILQDEDGYDRLHHHLFLFRDDWPVVPETWSAWAEEQKRGECALWFTLHGFFWFPRVLLGIERHLYAFYDQPDLVHRINRENAEWMVRVIDRVCEFCTPDFMTFAEDMSYNHGPMLSKELFDEFMKPYYDMVVPRLVERGILPIIDSDGDVTTAADWFAEAGLAGILPLERQAGVDLGVIREKHPRMCFIGHFDKMTMNRGEAAMRAEFERLLPLARQGGFCISCDHQTPPGVSYEQYLLYLELFREYAQEAAAAARGMA
jgi:hypothetical protein